MLRAAKYPVSTFAQEKEHEGRDKAEADREGERNDGHGENSGRLMVQWTEDEVQEKSGSATITAQTGAPALRGALRQLEAKGFIL